MSTPSRFLLPNPEARGPVPVQLPDGLSREQLLAFPAFAQWVHTLGHSLRLQETDAAHPFHAAPYRLRSIDVQAVDFFGGDRPGFVKLKADVTNDQGERLPGSVFLRGGSVGMLVILQPEDVPASSEREKHVVLTRQARLPAASLSFLELPAGMIDDGGNFAGAAAKEIHEELGLDLDPSQLTDLTRLAVPATEPTTGEGLQAAMYPSPGGSDEFVALFLHQRRVPRRQLRDWQGKLTGLRAHGEKITLSLVPLELLWREGGRDSKALAAWALYEGLRKEGRLDTGPS
ncbi:MAG: hypothetical protein M1826_003653 [Phylliscum demangeonii]|nr:MAG: hypothetical protein M1826_003653 [Phylliscum demangeonii]